MITRAIPVPQPECDLILHEGFDQLKVRWGTDYRGRAFVYAMLKPSSRAGIPLPRGGLVGVVDILNCVPQVGGGNILYLGNPTSIAFVSCGGRPCSWRLAPDIAERANDSLQEAIDVG